MKKNQMMAKDIAKILKGISRISISGNTHSTLASIRNSLYVLIEVLDPQLNIKPGVGLDTLDEKETGPENSREEVVGTSTRGTSSNFSNSGFGGGRPLIENLGACGA